MRASLLYFIRSWVALFFKFSKFSSNFGFFWSVSTQFSIWIFSLKKVKLHSLITGNTRFSESRLRMPQVHQTKNPLTFYQFPPATMHQFSFSSPISNFAGSHFGCFFNILPLDHALFFILPAHTSQFEHALFFILPVSTMFYLFLPHFNGFWHILTVSTSCQYAVAESTFSLEDR